MQLSRGQGTLLPIEGGQRFPLFRGQLRPTNALTPLEEILQAAGLFTQFVEDLVVRGAEGTGGGDGLLIDDAGHDVPFCHICGSPFDKEKR